jgi:hypothetical protein
VLVGFALMVNTWLALSACPRIVSFASIIYLTVLFLFFARSGPLLVWTQHEPHFFAWLLVLFVVTFFLRSYRVVCRHDFIIGFTRFRHDL